MLQNRKGFTLIELLIVVVIIGILAAIAIPRFGATRDRAFISQMQSDLRNLQTAQELHYSSNDFTYATATGQLADYSTSQGVQITISNANARQGWSAIATHTNEPVNDDGDEVSCLIYVGPEAERPGAAPANLSPGIVWCTGEEVDEGDADSGDS